MLEFYVVEKQDRAGRLLHSRVEQLADHEAETLQSCAAEINRIEGYERVRIIAL